MNLSRQSKAALLVATGVTAIAGVFYFGSVASSTYVYKNITITTQLTAIGGNSVWTANFVWKGTSISMYGDTSQAALYDAERAIDSYANI
jgi:hypothetical protein